MLEWSDLLQISHFSIGEKSLDKSNETLRNGWNRFVLIKHLFCRNKFILQLSTSLTIAQLAASHGNSLVAEWYNSREKVFKLSKLKVPLSKVSMEACVQCSPLLYEKTICVHFLGNFTEDFDSLLRGRRFYF